MLSSIGGAKAQEGSATFLKQMWFPQHFHHSTLVESAGKLFVFEGAGPNHTIKSSDFNLIELDSCYNPRRAFRIFSKDISTFLQTTSGGHANILPLGNGDMIAGFNFMDTAKRPGFNEPLDPAGGGLMRLTADGKIIWSKIYCGRIAHFKVHPDGTIYFIGDVISNDSTVCLGQVNQDGSLIRAVRLKTTRASAIDILEDGSILAITDQVVNLSTMRPAGNSLLMHFSSSLNFLWGIRLENVKYKVDIGLRQVFGTQDKGILLAGYDLSGSWGTDIDVIILKIDTSGKIRSSYKLYDNHYPRLLDEETPSMRANAARNTFYLGHWWQYSGGDYYSGLRCIDQNGSVRYIKSGFDGPSWSDADYYHGFYPEPTGELMFFDEDSRFYRIDSKAQSQCGGSDLPVYKDSLYVKTYDVSPVPVPYFFEQSVALFSEEVVSKKFYSYCESFPLKRKIPRDTALCFGNILKLDAGHTGAQRIWSTGDTAQVIEITKNGTYWVNSVKGCYHSEDTVNVKFIEKTFVELGADRTICPGDSTQFQAVGTVPGLTYQWNLPKKDASGQPIIVKGNKLWAKDSGMYTVKVADAGGCLDLDTVHVMFHPMPRPDAGPDTTICFGAVIRMEGKGGITYLWTPADYLDNAMIAKPSASPPKTQKYVLTISDTNGCRAQDTVWLKVKPPLQLQFDKKTVTVCQGSLVSFSAFASGGQAGQYKIEWQKKETQNWVQGNKTSWKADSSYSIIVRVNDGCSKEYHDSVYIIAVDTPRPQVSVIPVSGCEPLVVKGEVSGDTTGLIFRWDMGDGMKYTIAEPIHLYAKKGKYKVNVEVKNRLTGCHSELIIPGEIEVLESPKAIMDINPRTTDLFHPEINFTSRSKNAASIGWEMYGAHLSDKVAYTHVFSDTGAYIMKLIAYHKNGCTDTASGKVYIREPFVVYIPNTFTPNRDGLNEPFRPVLMGIAEAPMQIYNRWGERVFEGSGLKGWDGSFKGKLCAEGVYLYTLQVKSKEGERQYYSGTVTLLK
jgi:gliding motility-associated-like protein